jgi:hypothetical protein
MGEERFLWNKERTEMVRVGAIKQITIAEIGGGTYAPAPAERGPKKKPSGPEKSSWVVRVHFIQSVETFVMGIFDSLEEARQFVEGLQRHAEGENDHELLL